MNLSIIFQDTYFICVQKPNNVLVHHAHFSRNVASENSLLQLLETQTGEVYYPIHRLDRKTSGIILLATKKEYVAKFQALFTQNNITKTYFGVVRGFAPEEKIINSPVKGKDQKKYKEALTLLKTLNTTVVNVAVKPYDVSRYSLVELQPKTGRMHQLRIHTNKISHPLIGDVKYGDKNHNLMFEQHFGFNNMFLHAATLHFTHPFTEEVLYLKAPFPPNWLALFAHFNWKNIR